MRFSSICISVLISYATSAQTYTIKTQGSNNGNGGAYVAPVVTKTFTLPGASAPSNQYYSPSKSSSGNIAGNSAKPVTQKGSGSSDLYTPTQDKADAARNFSCLSGNCENGSGVYQGSPTSMYKYVGEFKNKEYHGKGKMYDWEGYLVYDGNFVDGKKEGFGKSIDYYQEPVFGDGSITRYNTAVKTVYEGPLKKGDRSGEAYLAEYTNKQLLVSIYTGSFAMGEKDGEGVLLLFAKEKISAYYSGGWLKGRYHGIGIDSSESGLYIGEYKNGYKDGEGTAYWSEYSTQTKEPVLRYTGQWKTDRRDGFGIEYTLKGTPVYEGNFSSGSRNGSGKLYNSNGTITQGVWVNGTNKELDPPVVTAVVSSKEFVEDFKDNKRLWPHNSRYFLATVQKGVYHVESIGGEKDYDNYTITIPEISFAKEDDWSFEVTRKASNKHGVSGWYGIGWKNAEFTINANADLYEFKYQITRSGSQGSSGNAKVKKGNNTLLVIKKGDIIEARLNGKKLFSGAAGTLSSSSLYLIQPKKDPSYGCYADYKQVVFKKLN